MIDFEVNKKQRLSPVYRVVFIIGGIFFIASGLLKFFSRTDIAFDLFFWIDAIYILLGLAWTLHALNIINLGIRGIVKIDGNKIYFNPPEFRRSTSISWDDINSIEIKITKLVITKNDKSITEIRLGWIPYNDLIKIKSEVENLTVKKGISLKK